MVFRVLLSSVMFLGLILSPFVASSETESNQAIPGDGLQAEGNGAWQTAVSIYLNVLLEDPNRVDLWLRVASIEHQLKNYKVAIDAYDHAVRLRPNDPDLHKTLSAIYAESNQPVEALFEINAAVKLKPSDLDYLRARAKIANWNKSFDVALDSDQQILALSKSKKQQLEILMDIGSLQNQLHHYPEAIAAFHQAIQIDPHNAPRYQALSQSYASAKDPQNAMLAIDQALTIDPTNIDYLIAKATFAGWLKNNTLAMETYQQILKLAPNNERALKGIKYIEQQAKLAQQPGVLKPLTPFEQLMNEANNDATLHHYDSAAKAMKQAIILRPKDAELYRKLSEIYATAKQAHNALGAINKAIELEPARIDYWRAKATLAAWVGDKIQTRDSYARILQLKPYDENAMLNYAHALAWLGETDDAIYAYRQLLSVYPRMAEGWIQYAEVQSWTGNYLGAFDALNHYKQLKGETTQYRQSKARFLALAGRFKSALFINEPLFQAKPNDPYLLSTEVVALTRSNQINKAVYYLKKLNNVSPNDGQVKGMNDIILTPLRSNINIEEDHTAASDTTRIDDVPVGVQYFLNPSTSLLLQGLYERATASQSSGLGPVNGNYAISDESVKIGFTKQIESLNLMGVVGGLKIQNGNNHGIYDVSVNTNLGENAQITFESLHNLYRPYLVPQTPRLISLQIMETRFGGALQWQPWVQKYLNVVMSYSDLTDNNSYLHTNIWPKARVYASQHWLVSLGVDGDFWNFRRVATDGYYSPLNFNGYEGTIEFYYGQSENIGFGFSGGFGMQKDETFPHYYYEEDLAAQLFIGIFTDWELQVKSGYTLRENPTGNYHCWTTGVVLTRRF